MNSRRNQSAFSLVELLVVIGVVAVLLVITVPAFNSITQGGKSTRAIYDVAGFLEVARAEAMARRTYVFVGAVNTTNANGNSEVRLGAVMTLDGTADSASSNLRPLGRLLKLESFRLVDYSGLSAGVKSAVNSDPSFNATAAARKNYLTEDPNNNYPHYVDFTIAGQDFAAPTPTLIFTPEGDVVSASNWNMFLTAVGLGLVTTRGVTPQTSGNSEGAVVAIYGGSSKVRIMRAGRS